MSHPKNKLDWCLKKAEKELKQGGKHRGLMMVKPSKDRAREYLAKSEYYLNATDYLQKGGFAVISTSTVFYSMYHCLLAIAAKFGYESGNQECTFALISSLIEDKKIVKEFKFNDFTETKYFLDLISIVAADQGHHPTLTLSYNKLKVTLTTHAIGGLSDNDFIMAKIIDELGA